MQMLALAVLLSGSLIFPCRAIGEEQVRIIKSESALWADQLVLTGERKCNSDIERPTGTWRELFFGRGRSMTCTDIVNQLEDWDAISKFGFFDRVAESPIAQHLTSEYRAQCLIRFSDITDQGGGYKGNRASSDHLTWISSKEQVETLRDSVGALSGSGGDKYCSATLVSIGEGRSGLLTAAHCLGQYTTTGEDNVAKLTYVFSDMVFTSISGQTLHLRLDDGFSGRVFNVKNGDVVFIPLPDLGPSRYLPLANFAAEMWEPLIIVGVNPYLSRAVLAEDQGVPNNLGRFVSVSMEPYCMLLARDQDGEIHHLCQTDRGQSGSAILVLRERQFYIAGIHSKGNFRKKYCCSSGVFGSEKCDAVQTGNSGVAIHEPVIGP
ncbi:MULTISPECIES: hypothetical protein [unclassified Mesorhizobium]|uniref:trypsin-like serine peptidase n=1 Tax=unclassified Mesorhizobium TaxID=325217 RepID=UPI0033384FEF